MFGEATEAPVAAVEVAIGARQVGRVEQVAQLEPLYGMTMPEEVDAEPAPVRGGHGAHGALDERVVLGPGLRRGCAALRRVGQVAVGIEIGPPQVARA